jgi:carboxyl-terminal processing protease
MAFPITAQAGEFVRVDLGDHRPGWVHRATGAPARPGARGAVAWMLHNSPPVIDADAGANLAVRGTTIHVNGTATDQSRVLDTYIFVGSRKVFYLSNRNGANPREVHFAADLPLRPGANLVTVVAREDDDTLSRHTYVIRRDGPAGQLLETPHAGTAESEEE